MLPILHITGKCAGFNYSFNYAFLCNSKILYRCQNCSRISGWGNAQLGESQLPSGKQCWGDVMSNWCIIIHLSWYPLQSNNSPCIVLAGRRALSIACLARLIASSISLKANRRKWISARRIALLCSSRRIALNLESSLIITSFAFGIFGKVNQRMLTLSIE